jgi:hypothetical protein
MQKRELDRASVSPMSRGGVGRFPKRAPACMTACPSKPFARRRWAMADQMIWRRADLHLMVSSCHWQDSACSTSRCPNRQYALERSVLKFRVAAAMHRRGSTAAFQRKTTRDLN